MGVFSAVAGNQLPNQLQKRVLPALFHLRCLAITLTFSTWTHTSDDSYIYQLSLVLVTATVSYIACNHKRVSDSQAVFQNRRCCWQIAPPLRQSRPYQPRPLFLVRFHFELMSFPVNMLCLVTFTSSCCFLYKRVRGLSVLSTM